MCVYIYTDLCYNEYLFTGNCGWGRVERSSMVVLSSLVVPLGLGTWDARVMCFFAFMPALSAVISLNSDDPLVPRSLCREGGALAHPFKSHLPNPFRRGPLPFQAFLKGFSTSHLQVRAEPSLPVPAAARGQRRWVCEHRWPGVSGMVHFRKSCRRHPLTQWLGAGAGCPAANPVLYIGPDWFVEQDA